MPSTQGVIALMALFFLLCSLPVWLFILQAALRLLPAPAIAADDAPTLVRKAVRI